MDVSKGREGHGWVFCCLGIDWRGCLALCPSTGEVVFAISIIVRERSWFIVKMSYENK